MGAEGERVIEQWPLTAAATVLLFHVKPSDSKKGSDTLPGPGPTKVAVRELLLRGAFKVEVRERKLRKHEIRLERPDRHVRLPEALHRLEGLMAPHVPDKLPKVLAKTRKGKLNPMAVVVNDAFAELERHGLAVEIEERGMVRSKRRRRLTPDGDRWRADAERRVEELRELVRRSEDPLPDDAELIAAHGSIIVFVNDGLRAVARIDPRRRRGDRDAIRDNNPSGLPTVVPYGGAGVAAADLIAFDSFSAVGEMLGASIDAGIAGSFDAASAASFDAGFASLDSAFDSISSSIDSAVSSGFDGGGGGGGDGGGGGGDGGGGGGN